METAQTGQFLLAKMPLRSRSHTRSHSKLSFFGVRCLWLLESVFIRLSIGQEAQSGLMTLLQGGFPRSVITLRGRVIQIKYSNRAVT